MLNKSPDYFIYSEDDNLNNSSDGSVHKEGGDEEGKIDPASATGKSSSVSIAASRTVPAGALVQNGG